MSDENLRYRCVECKRYPFRERDGVLAGDAFTCDSCIAVTQILGQGGTK